MAISTDGASRGNPGPAAIGATLKDEQGRLVAQISQAIGVATNNQAEYQAIITALKEAIRLGARKIDISMDAELVVKQIKGRYRVKNARLKPLFEEVKLCLEQLEAFTINHVPRRQNTEADNLANQAL